MSDSNQQRAKWELIILGCMYIGYMGYILCRTALSVSSPEMVKDPNLDFDIEQYGRVLAMGTLGMVAGKLLNGMVADWLGGRKVFIAALVLTAVMGTAFTIGTNFAFFASVNFIMLFCAASGWPAMANIIAAWYPQKKLGRVWGIVSTSSRLSALLSPILLGAILLKFKWQFVFYTAGAIGLIIASLIFFFLKARPQDVNLEKAVETETEEEAPVKSHFLDDKNPKEALMAFATSGRFWLMCLSLMCTTVLMEFITFLPLFIKSLGNISSAKAAMSTSVFPAGCFIALIAGGFLYDSVTRKGRIALLGGLLTLTCLAITVLGFLLEAKMDGNTKYYATIATLFLFGLTVAPAYYLPMSIFSNEFGGKHCGLLIGIIDAAGYGASAIYQFTGGTLVKDHGWGAMITLFFVISIVAIIITCWFAFEDYRRSNE